MVIKTAEPQHQGRLVSPVSPVIAVVNKLQPFKAALVFTDNNNYRGDFNDFPFSYTAIRKNTSPFTPSGLYFEPWDHKPYSRPVGLNLPKMSSLRDLNSNDAVATMAKGIKNNAKANSASCHNGEGVSEFFIVKKEVKTII